MEPVAGQKAAVSSARGQLMHQKRPKEVSWGNNDQETWAEDTLCVNQMANISFFLTFFSQWNGSEMSFFGVGGNKKKGNGFCIDCRADYLPFGIILSISKLKNVGQASFTIPPSPSSASFGLKWGAQVRLRLALPVYLPQPHLTAQDENMKSSDRSTSGGIYISQ